MKRSTGMSFYIGDGEIALYDKYADRHVGRLEARRQIVIPFLREHNLQNILEMGPGPGNSTFDIISSLPNIFVTAVDIDQPYINFAKEKLRLFPNRVKWVNQDIRKFKSSQKADVFIALGAFTDVSGQSKQRVGLLKKIRQDFLEKSPFKNKYIVLEEELLPTNGVNNRTDALWQHHGNVILDALLHDEFEVAYLELKALVSGLKHLGDHKTTLPKLVKEIYRAGFKGVYWKKIWPLPKDLIAEKSGIWEHHGDLIVTELLKTQPRQLKLESDPHFQKAVLTLKELHQKIRKAKGLVYQKGYLKRLDKIDLSFTTGEEAPTIINQPDKTGGVYVLIGYT